MSSLCRYCFQQYKIQILTVGVTNHKSLQAEHGIKSLSNLILTSHRLRKRLAYLCKALHAYLQLILNTKP